MLAVAWGIYMKVMWAKHTDRSQQLNAPNAIDKDFFFNHALEVNSDINSHMLPTAPKLDTMSNTGSETA